MSSADSQLLVATSATVEDVYHGFFNQDASEAQLVRYSRYVTLVLGGASVSFAYLAQGTSIYTLVLDYAWGGLGAALGPTIIACLWWKRLTAEGAVASMITGSVTMIFWIQLSTILGILGVMPAAETSPFLYGLVSVYGLFPALILSTLVLITVSLLTEPAGRADEEFDVFDKSLSRVTTDTGDTGTPTYVTDGGAINTNKNENASDDERSLAAVAEADVIRAYTSATGTGTLTKATTGTDTNETRRELGCRPQHNRDGRCGADRYGHR
jgi:sodium/proline symporter